MCKIVVSVSYSAAQGCILFLSVRYLFSFLISSHRETKMLQNSRFKTCRSTCSFITFVTVFYRAPCGIRTVASLLDLFKRAEGTQVDGPAWADGERTSHFPLLCFPVAEKEHCLQKNDLWSVKLSYVHGDMEVLLSPRYHRVDCFIPNIWLLLLFLIPLPLSSRFTLHILNSKNTWTSMIFFSDRWRTKLRTSPFHPAATW